MCKIEASSFFEKTALIWEGKEEYLKVSNLLPPSPRSALEREEPFINVEDMKKAFEFKRYMFPESIPSL